MDKFIHKNPPVFSIRLPKGQKFIRSIPLNWIDRASLLNGRALHVGLACWYLAGLKKNKSSLKISPKWVSRFGVNRFALYRGLNSLEQAGLIKVVRHHGRCALVEIIELTGVVP